MILFSALVFFSCTRSVTPAGSAPLMNDHSTGVKSAGPACMVYKTKADYNLYVPMVMSEDKTTILSYPDIRDIYCKGELAYPTRLADGYLLDNRGIGSGVVFLDYTYEVYSKLSHTPSPGELLKHILEKDPLLVLYDCGNRSNFSDPVTQLNEMIRSGKLPENKRLK